MPFEQPQHFFWTNDLYTGKRRPEPWTPSALGVACPDVSAPGRPGDSLRAIHQYLRVLPKGGCESVPMERRMEMRTRGEARSANKPNRGGVFLSVILTNNK